MLTIDTTNMCSHLQRKLFEEDGIYHPLWLAMQDDLELTAVVRSRQLHIYRNGKKVLPYMRQQHSGTIINVSSMGGRLTTYFGAWYHATKYAVEAFSDALRMEVSDFGINVSLIEPGGIKTEWGFIAADHLKESAKGGAYEAQATKTAEGMRKQYSGNMMSDPKVISKAISKAVNARRPKTRYLIGFMAKPMVWMHTILPTRWFDYIVKHAS